MIDTFMSLIKVINVHLWLFFRRTGTSASLSLLYQCYLKVI